MKVQVSYHVRLEVVVDTDTEKVERVVVCDDVVQLDEDPESADGNAVHSADAEYEDVEDPQLRAKALAIADGKWPKWQIGWAE